VLVVGDLQGGMSDDRPCRTPDREIRSRVAVDQPPARGDRHLELLHAVEVVDCGAQDLGGMLVLRKRVHEAQGAGHGLALDRGPLRFGDPLQVLAVRVDRGIPGGGGLLVRRVVVGGALVLLRRLAEIPVLQEEIGELMMDARRFGLLGKRGEVRAVPAQSLLEVRGLLGIQLRLLVERVVVVPQVLQVALQVAEHLGSVGDGEVTPVLGLQPVRGGELLLRLQHQFRESACLEDLDHTHAEVG
jgi:hypothetical protein